MVGDGSTQLYSDVSCLVMASGLPETANSVRGGSVTSFYNLIRAMVFVAPSLLSFIFILLMNRWPVFRANSQSLSCRKSIPRIHPILSFSEETTMSIA